MINDIIPNDKKPPREILEKAAEYARLRISQGKSPFASPEEEGKFKRMLEDGQ